MAEAGRVGADWRLSDLLGPAADRAARAIEAKAREIFRRSWGSNPAKREKEDDYIQDVLRGALETAHRITAGKKKEPENLEAWVNRVVSNAVRKEHRDYERKQKQRAFPELAEIAELAPIDRDLVWSIRKAIRPLERQMDPECVRLLRRRLLEDEPRDSLATWLGITANAVGVRIHRCLKRLRELAGAVGGSMTTFLEAH